MAHHSASHGASAAERVLDHAELLSRIVWSSAGGNNVLGIRELCAAACVRRAWREVVQDDAVWLPLLRAAAPASLVDEDALAHRGRGAYYRAFVQLHRLGVASLPPHLYLQDYTLLVDVSAADGATVACASMPLSDLTFDSRHEYARLEARTAALADGGAAAANFLARVAQRETDTRALRLQLLLRRADGAVAVLARRQRARRFQDEPDADDPHYNAYILEGLIEHEVWEAHELQSSRDAATWHSSHAPRAISRLFESAVAISDDERADTLPGRWTWALQLPADAGGVTQLSRLALRIGLRAKMPPSGNDHEYHGNVRFGARALAAMLERRSADTEGAWVPF